VDNAEYQTLLKHELLHHLTYTQIVNELSESTKTKLIEEAAKIEDYIADKFGKTVEGQAVLSRLQYALSRNEVDARVAEVVAILGAEVQIREFVEQLADVRTLNTLLKRFVSAVKAFLGTDKNAVRSVKYVLDGVDQIIKVSTNSSLPEERGFYSKLSGNRVVSSKEDTVMSYVKRIKESMKDRECLV